jgi:hypothetical protein
MKLLPSTPIAWRASVAGSREEIESGGGGREVVSICARATVESSPRGRARPSVRPPLRAHDTRAHTTRARAYSTHGPFACVCVIVARAVCVRASLSLSLSLSKKKLTRLRHGSLLTRLRMPSRRHFTRVCTLVPDTLVPERRSRCADTFLGDTLLWYTR